MKKKAKPRICLDCVDMLGKSIEIDKLNVANLKAVKADATKWKTLFYALLIGNIIVLLWK